MGRLQFQYRNAIHLRLFLVPYEEQRATRIGDCHFVAIGMNLFDTEGLQSQTTIRR